MAIPADSTPHISPTFLKQVFAKHTDGIALLDETGKIQSANPAFCSLLSLQEPQLQQLRWLDLSLIITEKEFELLVLPHLKQEENPPYFLQDRWLLQDDSLLYVQVHATSLWKEDGSWEGILLTVRESPSEDRADQVLASISETMGHMTGNDLFPMLVRSIGEILQPAYVMISVFDPIAYEAHTLALYAHGEMVAAQRFSIQDTPCELVISSKQTQIFPRNVQKLFPNSQMCAAWGIESYFGVPFLDSHQNILGYLSVLDSQEIKEAEFVYQVLQIYSTRIAAELERQQQERKLRESEEKFRKVFEDSPVGIILVDVNHPSRRDYFTEFNPQLCNMLGYTAEELRQLTYEAVTHPDDRLTYRAIKSSFDQQENQFLSVQKRYLRKDGSVLWADVSVSQIYRKGREWRIVLIRDITSQKEAEHQLQQQKKILDDKNQELKRYIESNLELENFAYIASHDLKQPLRTMGNFSQLLLRRYKDKLDESGLEYIDHIVSGAKQLNNLIEDLLIYSRINTHNQALGTEAVDIPLLLHNVLQGLNQIISEKAAHIRLKDLPSTIQANATQFHQLFQNLISNAIKFHKPGESPIVDIQCSSTATHYTFSVRDHGIGINEAYFDKIFLIFKKLHSPGQYEGTGIGLAICKRIVEQHHGDIWVESKEGKGTCFFFRIPIDPEDQKH